MICKKWSPPAVGSEERLQMPSSAFIDEVNRRYPYKEKVNGQWLINRDGLISAIRLSGLHGDLVIHRKAQDLLRKYDLGQIK